MQKPPATETLQSLSGKSTGHPLWCGAESGWSGRTLETRQRSEVTVPWIRLPRARKTGCQRSLCPGASAFQTAMAPGPGMELASERASGHCGLVPPEDSWRRTQQVRPGPGQHKLSPALSLLAHRPLVGLGPRLRPDVFAPSMGPEAQGASHVAPGKSGLHVRGEGERVIALEPW